MFFDICHEKAVHYDFIWSCGVHQCRVCGRNWYSVLPPTPKIGQKYVDPYWVEGWSWRRLFQGKAR